MALGAERKPEGRTVGGDSSRRSLFTYGSARRILTRTRYEQVFSEGEKVSGRLVVAWILRTGSGESRLGPIAAKRTFRHAVERNRARRLMREAFRRLRPFFCEGAWDLVLVGRRGLLTASSEEVLRDLHRMFAKRSILPGSLPAAARGGTPTGAGTKE